MILRDELSGEVHSNFSLGRKVYWISCCTAFAHGDGITTKNDRSRIARLSGRIDMVKDQGAGAGGKNGSKQLRYACVWGKKGTI